MFNITIIMFCFKHFMRFNLRIRLQDFLMFEKQTMQQGHNCIQTSPTAAPHFSFPGNIAICSFQRIFMIKFLITFVSIQTHFPDIYIWRIGSHFNTRNIFIANWQMLWWWLLKNIWLQKSIQLMVLLMSKHFLKKDKFNRIKNKYLNWMDLFLNVKFWFWSS